MYRWKLKTSVAGDCGAKRQTPEYLLHQCPSYNLGRKEGLLILDDNTNDWMLNVCPDI